MVRHRFCIHRVEHRGRVKIELVKILLHPCHLCNTRVSRLFIATVVGTPCFARSLIIIRAPYSSIFYFFFFLFSIDVYQDEHAINFSHPTSDSDKSKHINFPINLESLESLEKKTTAEDNRFVVSFASILEGHRKEECLNVTYSSLFMFVISKIWCL